MTLIFPRAVKRRAQKYAWLRVAAPKSPPRTNLSEVLATALAERTRCGLPVERAAHTGLDAAKAVAKARLLY